MNETLKYKYVRFPQIKLKLNAAPIGTIALIYIRPFIFCAFRESRIVVNRAIICVMKVAKIICHAVRSTGYAVGGKVRGNSFKLRITTTY